jgi:hypothetical protein
VNIPQTETGLKAFFTSSLVDVSWPNLRRYMDLSLGRNGKMERSTKGPWKTFDKDGWEE